MSNIIKMVMFVKVSMTRLNDYKMIYIYVYNMYMIETSNHVLKNNILNTQTETKCIILIFKN